jgi:hypothetical protein
MTANLPTRQYGLSTAGITLSGLSSRWMSTGGSPDLSQNCTYTSPWAATMFRYGVSSFFVAHHLQRLTLYELGVGRMQVMVYL